MQQGRAAMTINPFARLVTYNDPGKGKYARPLQVAAAADGGRSRRQARLCADGRILVAGDPEEREAEAARLGDDPRARPPRRAPPRWR